MVATMLDVFFSRRARRFNGNNVRKRPKIGHFSGPISNQIGTSTSRFGGIHLPSFRFSWKLKKLCRVDVFVFESWQTALKSQGKTITLFQFKTSRVGRKKYLQYGGRTSMTSSRDVTASPRPSMTSWRDVTASPLLQQTHSQNRNFYTSRTFFTKITLISNTLSIFLI
jgi:hypothetical protein